MRLSNLKIEQLNEKLKENSVYKQEISTKLQLEYDKLFDADKTLQKDMANAESASMFESRHDGIYSWYKVSSDLSMFNEYQELRPYLENYLNEHGLLVDWDNDCLMTYQGDDNYTIQDDCGRDNGVWQGHKLLFDESIYTDENGEVSEEKRNKLIESHMENTGYFPGVFRVTRYGDVYLVNTQKPKK